MQLQTLFLEFWGTRSQSILTVIAENLFGKKIVWETTQSWHPLPSRHLMLDLDWVSSSHVTESKALAGEPSEFLVCFPVLLNLIISKFWGYPWVLAFICFYRLTEGRQCVTLIRCLDSFYSLFGCHQMVMYTRQPQIKVLSSWEPWVYA